MNKCVHNDTTRGVYEDGIFCKYHNWWLDPKECEYCSHYKIKEQE